MACIMKNKVTVFFSILLSLLCLASPVKAGNNGSQKEFLQKVIARYKDWRSVELNGKLQMSRLPVSPSLKIYMERGSKIFISIRAPFMGEVGRLQIDGPSVTAVNKLKKVYVQEDLSALLGVSIPMKVEDVQDVLLARVFLTGSGTLSAADMNLCSVYDESDCMLLVPDQQPAGGSVRYGYTLDFDGNILDTYVTTVSENYAALLEYSSKGKKTEIDVSIQLKNKTYEALLQLDEPKWNPSKHMEPVEINTSWRRVSLSGFLKSF